VLRFAQQNPALTKYRSNLEIISELETSGKIPGEDAETLSRTLRLYLAKDNELKLGRRQAHLPAQAFQPEREAVSKLWQQYLESNSP
jgi:glutamine synthetase adenylyltransferase